MSGVNKDSTYRHLDHGCYSLLTPVLFRAVPSPHSTEMTSRGPRYSDSLESTHFFSGSGSIWTENVRRTTSSTTCTTAPPIRHSQRGRRRRQREREEKMEHERPQTTIRSHRFFRPKMQTPQDCGGREGKKEVRMRRPYFPYFLSLLYSACSFMCLVSLFYISNYQKTLKKLSNASKSYSTVQQTSLTAQYQGESGDCKQYFKSAVDEEGAEQSQAVVSQVFERQLEDVSPADTAKVDLLCRAVGRTTQHKELCVAAKSNQFILNNFE